MIEQMREVFENKKNLRLVLGAALAALLLILMLWSYMQNPQRLMNGYLAGNDYERAVALFNDRIAGHSAAGDYRKQLLGRISEIVDKWEQGRKTYAGTMSELNVLKNLADERLQSECQKQIAYVTLEENGDRSLRQAEDHLANGAYDKAYEAIARVEIEYSRYEDAKALAAECKEGVLNSIGAPNSVGAYERAIEMLKNCFAASGDIDLSKRQRQLEEEMDVFVAVSAILENAADLFDSQQYGEAFFALSVGLEQYPENPMLSEALVDYSDHYIIKITKEAEELCLDEKYDEAIALLDEAIENYDCETFQELRREIKRNTGFWHQIGELFKGL